MSDRLTGLRLHRRLMAEHRAKGLSGPEANRAALMQMTARPTEDGDVRPSRRQLEQAARESRLAHVRFIELNFGQWHRTKPGTGQLDTFEIFCRPGRFVAKRIAGDMIDNVCPECTRAEGEQP